MSEHTFIKRTLGSTSVRTPVEIIVPFHGQCGKVARLMETVFNSVITNRYQITLVDDASPNKDFLKDIEKAKIPGVVCMRTGSHAGFGAAVNMALKNPKNPWIPWVLVTHSDVYFEEGLWLTTLFSHLERVREKGVKMVSPRTDNPVESFPALTGEGDAVLGDGEYLPLYCALAHRELFKRVGYLKENPYAGGEAADFAARMRRMGFSQGVCGASFVRHDGRGTLSDFDESKKVQEILRKNSAVAT